MLQSTVGDSEEPVKAVRPKGATNLKQVLTALAVSLTRYSTEKSKLDSLNSG